MGLLDLTLRDGTWIFAQSVWAKETHGHLIEDLPGEDGNAGYLAHMPKRMERVFDGPCRVHLVPPLQRRVPIPPSLQWDVAFREELPRFEFAGEFYDVNKSKVLVIVWYQDEPEIFPNARNRAAIEALVWNQVAEELDP